MKKTVILALAAAILFSASAPAVFSPPGTSAEAMIVLHAGSGAVLAEKNADTPMLIASTTKLMTALTALDLASPERSVTVQSEWTTVEGSSMYLRAGESYTLRELLEGLLLASGNDAALAIAGSLGGDAFIEKMNRKAEELGLTGSHFANPHGLHDDNHYTTAEDLYKITQYAMSLPYFMDIVTQTEYTLPPTNLYTGERTIYTTNKMMDKNEPVYYEPYIEGIKTGSHDEAGYCLVTTAQKNGQRYMIVALGAPIGDVHGEMLDTKNLYDWAFQGFQESSPVLAHNVYPEIKRGQLWDKMNTVISSPWFVAICSMVIVIVVLLLSDYAQKYRHKKKNGK